MSTMVLVAFGQKKTVSLAKKHATMSTPDYTEARRLIKEALENEETKGNAETWYLAGWIENEAMEPEFNKLMLGQAANNVLIYDALAAMMPYFDKCIEIDYTPNKKGKVKPKYAKKMKAIYDKVFNLYINGADYYYNEKKDYSKSYEYFRNYAKVPTLKIYEKDKEMQALLSDSTYLMYYSYAGITAALAEKHTEAIEVYEALISKGYKKDEFFPYLANEYKAAGNIEMYNATLEKAIAEYPGNENIIMTLVQSYLDNKNNAKAIEYLVKGTEINPTNVKLYDIIGRIYEGDNNTKEARNYYLKALEVNPEYVESIGNLGRTYYNEALGAIEEANTIDDNVAYDAKKAEGIELYRKALPYLEKAHELDAENREYMMGLRGTYYALSMTDKYNEIEKKLGF